MEANDSEVQNSAIAAEIHDRITKFPDLYDTQVRFVAGLNQSVLFRFLTNHNNIDNIAGW